MASPFLSTATQNEGLEHDTASRVLSASIEVAEDHEV
jgi:hypothetical protein